MPTLKKNAQLPILEAADVFIPRPLSVIEYYHASVGCSDETLDGSREMVCIVEGGFTAEITASRWQDALKSVAKANIGVRIKLQGKRQKASWQVSDKYPIFREFYNCDWDGRSEQGAAFIEESNLDVGQGINSELIIAYRGSQQAKEQACIDKPLGAFLIFRCLHSVMDGAGLMHFMQEVFRYLRQESVQGTNAMFSDTDLMSRLETKPFKQSTTQPAKLTGDNNSKEAGDAWRRITLSLPQPHLLANLSLAVKEFSGRYSDKPVRIATPVGLRRHLPKLKATMNFTSMVRVDMSGCDSVEAFNKYLKMMLAVNSDAARYSRFHELLRYLPMPWLDKQLSRNKNNFYKRKNIETALISYAGNFKPKELSCEEFLAEGLFSTPAKEAPYLIAFRMGSKIELTIGMAKVFGSDGRMDDFVDFLQDYFAKK